MLPTSSNAKGARIAGAKAAKAAMINTPIPINDDRVNGESVIGGGTPGAAATGERVDFLRERRAEPFPISYRSRRTRERRSASASRHASIFLWSPDSRISGTVCPR